MTLSHNTLQLYYVLIFQMMQYHKWSISEVESMMPWERDVYVAQIQKWIREEQQKMDRQSGVSRAG